ncbi:unnamed protein product [Adineta ricciae]|uniref:Ig-like domain-containing protein n=1 Tax=Adineta ricciae TaxID=249248 RepID=A0A814YFL8_ADIRI|nr:unnamed protein product [Adineta ricciae]CAF1228831.1 unnamed protein product [Adineta ricciae]
MIIIDIYILNFVYFYTLSIQSISSTKIYKLEQQFGSTIVLPPCLPPTPSSVDIETTILFKSNSGELLTLNGVLISDNPRLTINNRSSTKLIIEDIDLSDQGEYECRTNEIIIYLFHLMVVKTSFIQLTAVEGSNVTLRCVENGMWIIEESPRGGTVRTQYTSELILNNIQRDDRRFQKILCSTLDGHEKREYIIDVMYKPTVKLTMSVREKLMCIVCAHPLPYRIQWLRNARKERDEIVHQANINQSCIVQEYTSISRLTSNREEVIECEAENIYGSDRDIIRIGESHLILIRPVSFDLTQNTMSPPSVRQPGDVVNEVYSENIKSIIQTCLDAGDDPNSLIEQAKRELHKMVTEMMAEDDALLERKRAELAPIRVRYEALYHELHPDKTCPQYGNTLPVLQALRTYIDEHKKLKEEHEKLLEREPDIRQEERQLCNELNERSLQIDNQTFLSKQLVAQMSLLSEHIAKLREERTKRIDHLSEIIRMLHEFEEVYGWKRPLADTMVGRLLALGPIEVDKFTLTKEAIELVDKEFAQINEKIQKAEACFEQSHKQLTALMRKHQSLIPNSKALAATKVKHCRMSKLPDLVAEVDRYTEHALDKLTKDIIKAREQIHVILNKLSVGDVSNDSKYAILYTNDFTEDIYFMHEELLQELEAQYEVNKTMYEQIEVWNELFLEFQEFEKNASDPQRFHRRGYSALAEEKTRRKLEATLRECESRLENLAEDYMKKNNGQVFIMNANGKEIPEYIRQRKEDYAKSKEREREAAKTPASKKKARTDTIVRARPAPLQSVPGGDDNTNISDDNQCATTLCAAPKGTLVGRTPLKTKQFPSNTSSAISKRTESTANLRTPLTTARRAGMPQLPTGKTPLHNSTMQLRTTKRTNIDTTSSTIVTPAKQRRLINQMHETMKIPNTTENMSSHSILTTTLKTSTIATPGKREIPKRAIPTPIRTHKAK